MNIRYGQMALNRHDRKRGMQPKELTCPSCKSDLGIVGVQVLDAVGVLHGVPEGGSEPGTCIIRAEVVYGIRTVMSCGECGASIDRIKVVDYYITDDTEFHD